MIHEQKTLAYKGRVVFEKMTLSYFHRMPKKFDKNEACFMFINKGEFSVRTPDVHISFDKDNALLSKCFNYFFETNEAQRNSSDNLEIMGIMLYPSMVEELFQFDLSRSSHKLDYNVKQIPIDALMNNFRSSLDILLDNPDLADELMIENKLKEFVLLLSKTQGAESQLDFLSAIFRTNTTEFKTAINNNLYSSLSLEEFARLCNMSVSSFKRKFKEAYGKSPKKYLLKRKLDKATEMLRMSEDRITNIAYECGFESLATFNRNFKKEYGASPSEYRFAPVELK